MLNMKYLTGQHCTCSITNRNQRPLLAIIIALLIIEDIIFFVTKLITEIIRAGNENCKRYIQTAKSQQYAGVSSARRAKGKTRIVTGCSA